jgi:hypothetical protein
MQLATASPSLALVSRPAVRPHDPSQYLLLTPEGAQVWTADPEAATAFASMREAMRAAFHLTGSLRAFGLPRHAELAIGHKLH